MVDMATGLAVRGEQVTPLLSFHLYVPHLHLVLCHLSPEGKQTSCNAHLHGEYMRCYCGSAHFAWSMPRPAVGQGQGQHKAIADCVGGQIGKNYCNAQNSYELQ